MSDTKLIAAGAADAKQAVLDVLAQGNPVALPSETVYGLFSDATSPAAVARIYAVKGRPMFNPLIAHCADAEMAGGEGHLDDTARALADAFWPGPLTLVVPRRTDGGTVCDLACAGLDTVGLRVPDATFLRSVIAGFGRPLAGPSANLSGRLSPTNAKAVLEDLQGRIAIIADDGDTPVGIESTIIACVDGNLRLLRPGGIAADDIIAVIGDRLLAATATDKPQAPGMLSSHYAPASPLRLNARRVLPGEALLAFGPIMPDGFDVAAEVLNLSPRGDLTRAAANLYRYLRALDRYEPVAIAVMPIPETGLGAAIADRLHRASAPRDESTQD